MAVGISTCLKCKKEFKWKKTSGIPAKWCSRKCQRIRIERKNTCETCGETYTWKESKAKKTSRFCSRNCRFKKVREWNLKNRFVWKTASEKEYQKKMKEKFNKYVIKSEKCWDWKGPIYNKRYIPFKTDKLTYAHVVSWKIYKGKIPAGKFVCHTCDNPRCTNPEHLFLGTPKDNIQDMIHKKRNRYGSNHYMAKLDEKKVREIKSLIELGLTYSKIAKKYEVTPGTIFHIAKGTSWKHVV